MESISDDILEEADPLHSFVERITKAANDCIPRATTIPKKSNPWFDGECREALKARQALIPMAVSDHYPTLTSILPSVAETQPSCDPSHWVFSKANWEEFHDVCLKSIAEDTLGEADPLHSFVEHITKAANECIPRATTIPKKSNPWFDEECREALKARRALDERVEHSRELRRETISAFRRSQVKARQLFNQKKRQSWAEYVSKLSTKTPIKHVWDRVRKISGKNICPPKQSLNGKNGTTITDQKILLKNTQQYSQTTPPLPTRVLHSRP